MFQNTNLRVRECCSIVFFFLNFSFNMWITSIPSFWRCGLYLRRQLAECRHQRIWEARCQGTYSCPHGIWQQLSFPKIPHVPILPKPQDKVNPSPPPLPRWTLQSWTMVPTWLVSSEWTEPGLALLTLLWRKWEIAKDKNEVCTYIES